MRAAPEGTIRKCKTWGYLLQKRNGRWVRQHRLLMEQHLGRKLKRGEVVHHINEDRMDNRLGNLQLMSDAEHRSHHSSKSVKSEKTKQRMREAAIRVGADPKERKRRSDRAKAQWKQGNLGRKAKA